MHDGVVPASFRDPSGFLFVRDGILYRQVNESYREPFEKLISSGLYESLAAQHLLIPHSEVDEPPAQPEHCFRILRPVPIPFISYPYEWCFGQLKAAALTTLVIQKRAIEFGMSLKDASAFNVQFLGNRPIFIDTLSFEAYNEGAPWVAYRQFCQHFLAPLALMCLTDFRLNRLMSLYVDGIPLDLASKLLPRRSRLKMSVLTHIHLHSRVQRRYEGEAHKAPRKRRVSKMGLLGIVDSLESAIKRMVLKREKTVWGDYYSATNYTPAAFDQKKRIVGEFIDRVGPGEVWDLGANTGEFSKIASGRGLKTVAFDSDPVAVESLYQDCQKADNGDLLPLIMDLTNPSASIGWSNRERMSLLERGPTDTVMALALVHHLAIGNNVPLSRISDFFSRLCRFLIIEFVPKQDSQVERMLSTREDVFDTYDQETFEREFERNFTVLEAIDVADSVRTLYLMEKRAC